MIWLGLLLALTSATLINLGLFVEHRATTDAVRLELRHPLAGMAQLLKSPAWLFGYTAGWIGWGVYVVALWFAPLSLVQGVSAGGLGIIAVLVEKVTHVKLSRGEWTAVGASVTALVVIATTVAFAPSTHEQGRSPTTALIAVGVLVALGGIVFAAAATLANWGSALGAVAGVSFAAGDVATKAAIVRDGWVFVGILVVANVLAFVALQLSFQRGGALATLGVSTLLNNALPVAAGIFVFGERLPRGPAGIARIIAFAAAIGGATYLARRPAGGDDSGGGAGHTAGGS